jgi:hypothetical protein
MTNVRVQGRRIQILCPETAEFQSSSSSFSSSNNQGKSEEENKDDDEGNIPTAASFPIPAAELTV